MEDKKIDLYAIISVYKVLLEWFFSFPTSSAESPTLQLHVPN